MAPHILTEECREPIFFYDMHGWGFTTKFHG
jgi:hypothetical protein